jgi:hypothetical protein
MGLKEIEAEIRRLDLKDRASLAKLIVESLDDLSEAEVEALWAEEAERRLDEMEQVNEIPAKEVLRRARNVISSKTDGRKATPFNGKA